MEEKLVHQQVWKCFTFFFILFAPIEYLQLTTWTVSIESQYLVQESHLLSMEIKYKKHL